MIIGFTGHRNSTCDPSILEDLATEFPGATWVHGGAVGFDTQVSAFAVAHAIAEIILRPDYDRYGSKLAPILRNKDIVARSELLIACYDGRKKGGTFATLEEARRRGVTIRRHSPIEYLHRSTPKVIQGSLF